MGKEIAMWSDISRSFYGPFHIHNVIEGTPTKASTVITTTTDKAITTKQGKITNEPEIEYYKNINTTPHDILNSDLNILSSSPSKRRLG